MPREQISDHSTDVRKVEVTWRRDENEPGYVQLATKDSASVAAELIGTAVGIISNVDAPAADWPVQAEEWRTAARVWLDRAAQVDVDGTFAHLGPDECQHLIKTLHKAKRQAFGPAALADDEHALRDVTEIGDSGPRWVCIRPEHDGQQCQIDANRYAYPQRIVLSGLSPAGDSSVADFIEAMVKDGKPPRLA